MSKHSSHCNVVFASCVLVCMGWAGAASADDSPSPASAAPNPVPEAKSQDSTQDTLAPNSVFAEGLGAAIGYSINYERLIIDELGVRVGLSYLPLSASVTTGGTTSSASASFLFIPITASYVGIRSGKNALELGGGVTLLYASGSANAAGVATSGSGIVPFGVATVGYRLQPVDHAGFMFRIGMNALVASGLGLQSPNPNTLGILPWPYISLGASF